MATSKGNLDRHKITVHERVKYPFRQREHNTTTKGHLVKQKREIHEGVICSLCLQVIKEDAIKQTHEERLHCKLIIYWKLSISKYECCLKQPQFIFFDNVGQLISEDSDYADHSDFPKKKPNLLILPSKNMFTIPEYSCKLINSF